MSTKPRGRIGGNRSDRNGTARNGINRNGTSRNRINRNGTDRNGINRNGTGRNRINRNRTGRNGINRNGTDRNRQKSRRAKSVLKAVILLEMLAIGVVVYALRLSMRAGGNEGRDSLTGISEVFAGYSDMEPADGSRAGVDGLASEKQEKNPPELLKEYMELITQKAYEQMYAMVDAEGSGNISEEAFVSRNSAIYEGIEAENMTTEVTGYDEEKGLVTFQVSFDTLAGNISFENEALFLEIGGCRRLVWSDSLIFPGLCSADKVRVSVTKADRGRIVDRNGEVLAGSGVVSSVGIVPGKLEDEEEAVSRAAELLGMEEDVIRKKLSAGWVKEDSFVPLKLIPRVDERKLMSPEAEEAQRELERHEKLLEVPGIAIQDQTVRSYPLGEAASHLTGYVQNVTAEDLEEHAGEGYTAGSVIGRCGIEALYEKELRGRNGYRIYITDEEGQEKRELARRAVQHGTDVKLTIDAALQAELYEEFKEDKSCSVAMEPYTGEVLALVSTPSYDSNDFIMGMSTEKWSSLNEDENIPMLNRFRQAWCPGSTFKAVIAAIGLETGAVDPLADLGNDGARWQKDRSWGGYHVTTLHPASPADLRNAMLLSDNIYFAKAALQIGAERLETSLSELGFGETLPFEIGMTRSRFSNGEHMETEIQLADSGYGQGQILVNPLHLASMYSAFCNEGNLVQPWVVISPKPAAEVQQDGENESTAVQQAGNGESIAGAQQAENGESGTETRTAEASRQGEAGYWIPGAFSRETAEQVLESLKGIVNDPGGTGYGAHREDVLLAGKTGTAEIKASQSDTSGTELGWMVLFTPEKTVNRPIMLVSMTEDVKGRGGSGYVVKKDKKILEFWFGGSGT